MLQYVQWIYGFGLYSAQSVIDFSHSIHFGLNLEHKRIKMNRKKWNKTIENGIAIEKSLIWEYCSLIVAPLPAQDMCCCYTQW